VILVTLTIHTHHLHNTRGRRARINTRTLIGLHAVTTSIQLDIYEDYDTPDVIRRLTSINDHLQTSYRRLMRYCQATRLHIPSGQHSAVSDYSLFTPH
jgi:hypothetical protein